MTGRSDNAKVVDVVWTIGYAVILTIALLAPVNPPHPRGEYLNEQTNLVDFGINIAAFLPLGWGLSRIGRRLRRPFLVFATVGVTTFLFSLAIETLQYLFTAGRYSSIADVVANTTGAVLGASWRHGRETS